MNYRPRLGYGEAMRTAGQWLSEYGDSHQNPTNEFLHWICVPIIVWCVMGFLWLIPFPSLPVKINWAWVMIFLAVIYYAFLSLRLALGAALMFAVMAWSINALAHSLTIPLWWVFAGAFVLAWIGQFVGHAVEGKRPSFLEDLQFLLIGPIWLLSNLYRSVGLSATA
ncbi:MAG TPA: Mpo1-like protein [Steroidobacteraceae bacterium]